MIDTEHHNREMTILAVQLHDVEHAPLADRQAAREDMCHAMIDHEEMAERVIWAMDGTYGYGAMVRMREIAANTRMNRPAAAMQLIGALDWNCPADFVRDAWKRLTPEQKIALDAAVLGALVDYEVTP